jgi:hypothetical protein
MADRKISDLTALTTPASGDFLPIVDISEAAAASKNKRITIEELFRGVPLGTAAAPSIAIEGNENTGVFSPGANQLAVATNGTGRLFVDSAGKIGIGAASVAGLLQIKYATDVHTSFRNATAGGLSAGTLIESVNDAFNSYNPIYLKGSEFAFGTDSAGSFAERLRITSAGLVGVGTSSPVSTLTVNGIGAFGANSGSADVSAARELYIRGASNSSLISFQTSSTGSNGFLVGQIADQARIQVVDAHPLTFHTTNTERARIDSSGRLGIGTSSPRVNVHILGTASNAPTLGVASGSLIVGPGDRDYGLAMGTAAAGYSWIQSQNFVSAGAAYSLLLQPSGGNVGIGTASPALKFVVSNDGNEGFEVLPGQSSDLNSFYHYNRGSSAYIDYRVFANTHQFYKQGSSEAARIDSSGRLLVGTSTANANGGILQLTSGITFPATAVAASDANTLDDYEEGTWTPNITNTGYTYTYSNQTGTYTKVGRKVTLSWRVAVTARSGSASGGLPVVAIPFTASSSFVGSLFMSPGPAQLVAHKAGIGATSGVRTLLYSGFANSANSHFLISAIDTSGDSFDFGADFLMGGVFTYEV